LRGPLIQISHPSLLTHTRASYRNREIMLHPTIKVTSEGGDYPNLRLLRFNQRFWLSFLSMSIVKNLSSVSCLLKDYRCYFRISTPLWL
jgi:hypothetical protein